jgi:hypothetical protein
MGTSGTSIAMANPNPTGYWEGTSTQYPGFNMIWAQAKVALSKLLSGLNYGQMSAVTDPYVVNLPEIGETVNDQSGKPMTPNKVKLTPYQAQMFTQRALPMILGQPENAAAPFTWFISLLNPDGTTQDINLGQAIQTPNFAVVPSGNQSAGGGFLTGTCPVVALNAPVYPPLPPVSPPLPQQSGGNA